MLLYLNEEKRKKRKTIYSGSSNSLAIYLVIEPSDTVRAGEWNVCVCVSDNDALFGYLCRAQERDYVRLRTYIPACTKNECV